MPGAPFRVAQTCFNGELQNTKCSRCKSWQISVVYIHLMSSSKDSQTTRFHSEWNWRFRPSGSEWVSEIKSLIAVSIRDTITDLESYPKLSKLYPLGWTPNLSILSIFGRIQFIWHRKFISSTSIPVAVRKTADDAIHENPWYSCPWMMPTSQPHINYCGYHDFNIQYSSWFSIFYPRLSDSTMIKRVFLESYPSIHSRVRNRWYIQLRQDNIRNRWYPNSSE